MNVNYSGFKHLFNSLIDNPEKVFRFVLFLTFVGHGLISLNFSPSYSLHYKIMSTVNFLPVSTETLLVIQGIFDITMSFLILFNKFPRIVLPVSMFYFIIIGFSVWFTVLKETATPFGIAEFFRRFPWLFFALFLFQSEVLKKKEYFLLRVGLSFAFIAHGMASLGLGGFTAGHIDLADNIIPKDIAPQFVYYSGLSDIILGSFLLTGIFSRYAAFFGIFWIALIDYSSFLAAVPDGLFRMGFLIAAIYLVSDRRPHERNLLTWLRRKG